MLTLYEKLQRLEVAFTDAHGFKSSSTINNTCLKWVYTFVETRIRYSFVANEYVKKSVFIVPEGTATDRI